MAASEPDTVRTIAFDALRQIYEEAEPGMDFDHALDNPDEYGESWYTNHYLPSERQREIVDEHCATHDLTDKEEVTVHWTAILNYGPAGSEDAWDGGSNE